MFTVFFFFLCEMKSLSFKKALSDDMQERPCLSLSSEGTGQWHNLTADCTCEDSQGQENGVPRSVKVEPH